MVLHEGATESSNEIGQGTGWRTRRFGSRKDSLLAFRSPPFFRKRSANSTFVSTVKLVMVPLVLLFVVLSKTIVPPKATQPPRYYIVTLDLRLCSYSSSLQCEHSNKHPFTRTFILRSSPRYHTRLFLSLQGSEQWMMMPKNERTFPSPFSTVDNPHLKKVYLNVEIPTSPGSVFLYPF